MCGEDSGSQKTRGSGGPIRPYVVLLGKVEQRTHSTLTSTQYLWKLIWGTGSSARLENGGAVTSRMGFDSSCFRDTTQWLYRLSVKDAALSRQ